MCERTQLILCSTCEGEGTSKEKAHVQDKHKRACRSDWRWRRTFGFDTIMQLSQKLGIPNEPSE